MTWILLAGVGVPLLGAAAVALLSVGRDAPRADRARTIAVWSSGITLLAGIAVLVAVAADGRLDLVAENDEGRALFGLTAGRVEAALLVLTSFVGLVVQSYAGRSLAADRRAPRFHGLALALVGATNLAATAASGATFVVGWVGTSIVVTALVAHRRGWHAADRSQRTTQRAFGFGDLALLAGIVMATTSAGHFDLRSVDDVVVQMDSTGAVALVAVLLVIAGLVRSAIIPFGAWLPTTLAAPTPVSALLHAGVVNGAGVLIIRFHPMITESAAALILAYVAGVTTAVLATAIMIVRTDVKGGLVWSTAGQLGFMVAQLGAGAFAAAFFHLIGHAMYKAAAFLGAGGAIAARNQRSFRPARHGAASVGSVALSIGIAGASVAGALLLLDPHLTDSGLVLVATFATLTLARAIHGWIVSTALAAAVVVPGAGAGSFLAALAYVGGLKIVEGFVVDEVPFEVANAVSAPWVIATVAGAAAAAVVLIRLPGTTGDRWRRAAYARLVGWGSSTAPVDRTAVTAAGGAGPLHPASPAGGPRPVTVAAPIPAPSADTTATSVTSESVGTAGTA